MPSPWAILSSEQKGPYSAPYLPSLPLKSVIWCFSKPDFSSLAMFATDSPEFESSKSSGVPSVTVHGCVLPLRSLWPWSHHSPWIRCVGTSSYLLCERIWNQEGEPLRKRQRYASQKTEVKALEALCWLLKLARLSWRQMDYDDLCNKLISLEIINSLITVDMQKCANMDIHR